MRATRFIILLEILLAHLSFGWIFPKAHRTAGDGTRISSRKCNEYVEFRINHESSNLAPPWLQELNFRRKRKVIVGGTKTAKAEFPHMAAIGSGTNPNIDWFCGGSLISEKFVLTAAHCGVYEEKQPNHVRLGDYKQIYKLFNIEKFIKHPDHRYASTYNDIALIKLNQNVEFDHKIRPACLWTLPMINDKDGLIATGWGATSAGGDSSLDLLKINIGITDHNHCKSIYQTHRRYQSGLVDSQLCAGDLSGKRDTCQGDSGGPLQILNSTDEGPIYHIVGVTSFGKVCAGKNEPGVYSKVSSFINWIEPIVWA